MRSLALVVPFIPAAFAPLQAQTVELSGTFTPPIVGNVEFLRFPGNGRVVYYVRDPNFTSSVDHFSVLLDGSGPRVDLVQSAGASIAFSADGNRAVCYASGSLVTTLTDGSGPVITVDSYPIESMNNYSPYISPDGQWVVYYLTEGPIELRSARSDGSGAPHVLYSAHVPLPVIGPDSTRVFFCSTDLFMAPIDGSASALNLSGPHVTGGSVDNLVVSPDGTRVVYVGDVEAVGFEEMYSVSSDGSASPVKLSAGGEVQYPFSLDKPSITPNGNLVVYRVDREIDGNIELCSVRIDGSASPVELSGSMGSGRDVTRLLVTPDGRRVLYLADRDVDEQFELFVASVEGLGQPMKLSGPVAGDVREFAVSADSSYAVYRADQAQVGQFELFSAPTRKIRRGDAPRVVKLNLPLAPGTALLSEFQIAGRRVVYTVSLPGGRYESFSVPIHGGPAIPLTPDFGPGGYVGPVQASPEGIGVFEGSQGALLGERIFSEPLDASSAPADITGPLGFGSPGEVNTFLLTPDGQHAVYAAGEDVASMLELHYVPTNGSLPAVEISGTMPLPGINSYGDVKTQMSADGARVAYLARQEGDTVRALYEGPIDGSAPAEKRTGAEGETFEGFVLAPDGEHLVYRAAVTPFTQGLYAVRADGSLPPARLNIAGGGNQVLDFAVSSNGARVVYRSDELVSGKSELFTVPTDANATRVRLHGLVAGTRDVGLFALDPTSQRVAFSADHGIDNAFDLWSVPIDASSAPVRLNPALPAGREVRAIRFSSDGQRVLYTVDQDTDQVIELFSAPSDGSAPAVKLNVPPVPGGNVADFELDPDGTRVVYRADQDQDNEGELYSVPLDGSALPVKLNAPLAPGTDVLSFSVAPERVLYTEGFFQGQAELHSVPLDGSASARHLSGGTAVGAVDLFAFSPSGTRVVFTATNVGPDTLFLVAIDGLQAPHALGSFQTIEELAFTADGARVVHRSSLPGEPNARLFSTRMPRLGRRPR
ncbi:MAG: hypothetical protein HOP15_15065 [Planctomycetes bacterium]|nr:hypothetical protein [Planctomycetota bacterium]